MSIHGNKIIYVGNNPILEEWLVGNKEPVIIVDDYEEDRMKLI